MGRDGKRPREPTSAHGMTSEATSAHESDERGTLPRCKISPRVSWRRRRTKGVSESEGCPPRASHLRAVRPRREVVLVESRRTEPRGLGCIRLRRA